MPPDDPMARLGVRAEKTQYSTSKQRLPGGRGEEPRLPEDCENTVRCHMNAELMFAVQVNECLADWAGPGKWDRAAFKSSEVAEA